jgi:uncharacterized protein
MTDRLSLPVHVKAAAREGVFAGYASTFGGPPDCYGDIIEPGAFAKTLKSDRAVAMLWAHDPSEPIGKWGSLSEDRVGLRVEGKLALTTQRGGDAYELLKMDALGLSIGYRVANAGATYSQDKRVLKEVELFEISAVAMPANSRARVTSVKGVRPETVRDFESLLRGELGFSAREAKAIASHGWRALSTGAANSGELSQIAALLRDAAAQFNR